MMRTYSAAFLIASMLVASVSATANPANISNQGNGKTNAPQLYARHCASCHGADGRAQTSKGKFSHARDLTDAKWQDDVTDERIFNSIMNGRNVRGNMPAFSDKLSEKDADDLVRYVRRFKG
ncbi:MAG TPA: cytochrome c [Pyrinomonadaceae bacterium]|nr:cytochrome c [Pyrinomonadaceae bacterium]